MNCDVKVLSSQNIWVGRKVPGRRVQRSEGGGFQIWPPVRGSVQKAKKNSKKRHATGTEHNKLIVYIAAIVTLDSFVLRLFDWRCLI